jgi:serine phosphatase RsbU (regulator of sigma subunit)
VIRSGLLPVLSEQLRERLLIAWCLFSALLFIAFDLSRFEGLFSQQSLGLGNFEKNLLLVQFELSCFLLFRELQHRSASLSFLEQIQKVFSNALFVLLLALIIKTFLFLNNRGGNMDAIHLVLDLIFFAAVCLFLFSSFFTWKRLISYQKTRSVARFWSVFEWMILFAIFFQLLDFHFFDNTFLLAIGAISSLGLLLSFNLKWVAYLNLVQKGQSLLLILTAAACTLFMYSELSTLSSTRFFKTIDLSGNLVVFSLFVFFISYSVISLLVVTFNLPTSSVFEQKFGDLLLFQRINEVIELGRAEKEVAQALLEGSQSSTASDAACLDIFSDQDSGIHHFATGIEEDHFQRIKHGLFSTTGHVESLYFQNINLKKILKQDVRQGFLSALVIPLRTSRSDIGQLILLKKVSDGFEKEMVDLVKSFTISGAQSIHNTRLLNQEKEKERLQAQMDMASEVQKGLIPLSSLENDLCSVAAAYKSALEIGGDYFDLQMVGENIAFVMGDVSGKGASAAINMAQMKGVFQSLILTHPDPASFIALANQAIGNCLKERSFITLLYVYLSAQEKNFCFARAGHCPALFYKSKTGESSYLNSKGLGLGIIKSAGFYQHIETPTIPFESNDLLLIFTDGIVEARNTLLEEFGYERIEAFLVKHVAYSVQEICRLLQEEVQQFTGGHWDDDYAIAIFRFK